MHPLLDEATLRAIHTGTYTDLALTTAPCLVLPLGNRVQVQVAVLDAQGRRVGELRNGFTLTNGEMEVRYQIVELDPSVRGHGFGEEFFGALERDAKRHAADLVTLHTWRTGNYLFAKLDFDFNVYGNNAQTLLFARQRYAREVVEEALLRSSISSDEFAEIEPQLIDLANPTPDAISRPGEIAELPGDLGKRILSGHQWDGIKWLS